MRMTPPIPILRIFDEAAARAFYIDFLGFAVDWEHRFEPDLPLYMEIRRDDCVLHLSGHHGDATPGAAIRIEIDDIAALHAELSARPVRPVRPGIVEEPWGFREMTVIDPFANRLVFCEPSD
jgi:catechol 2,3-dioxygenase-like lactoylglutathione lyase family enzyme